MGTAETTESRTQQQQQQQQQSTRAVHRSSGTRAGFWLVFLNDAYLCTTFSPHPLYYGSCFRFSVMIVTRQVFCSSFTETQIGNLAALWQRTATKSGSPSRACTRGHQSQWDDQSAVGRHALHSRLLEERHPILPRTATSTERNGVLCYCLTLCAQWLTALSTFPVGSKITDRSCSLLGCWLGNSSAHLEQMERKQNSEQMLKKQK